MLTPSEIELLHDCPLFADIPREQLPQALGCLAASRRRYEKHSTVFTAGDPVRMLGVVLAGRLHVEQVDYWGNLGILTQLEAGDLFGESFAYAGMERLPVSVTAIEASEVLLVDPQRLVSMPACDCGFHSRLIRNMLAILAQKNVFLTQKAEIVSQRSTRGKLLMYLSLQAKRAGSHGFTIPFDRQQLADYLAVDRSAMSSELSRMQKEGLLETQRNHFVLK